MLPPVATAISWTASGREDVGKPSGLSKQAGTLRGVSPCETSVPALTSQSFGSSLAVQKHLVPFLLLPTPLNVELKGNTIHHLPRGLPFSQELQRLAFNHTRAGAEGSLPEDTLEKHFH